MDVNETWEDLGLCPQICQMARNIGWEKPTQIQAGTIKQTLNLEDVAGMAETGSGKTGAYLLPILHLFLVSEKPPGFAVILAPSHELAIQIDSVIHDMMESCPELSDLKTAVVYGGVDDVSQMAILSQKPHIIIATPGRLAQLIQNARGFNLHGYRIVVVDEADRMAGLSFFDEIQLIVSSTLKNRQILLFSATMPEDVKRLATLSVSKSNVVKLGEKRQVPKSLCEQIVVTQSEDKESTLVALLKQLENQHIIIFFGTCRMCQIIGDTLKNLKFQVGIGHGQTLEKDRKLAMDQFREGTLRILCSTNVAARGIDIPSVDAVINYDLPPNAKEYIHRSGRAGRANRHGYAITFVTLEDLGQYQILEKKLNRKIEARTIPENEIKAVNKIVEEAKEKAVNVYKVESRKRNQT